MSATAWQGRGRNLDIAGFSTSATATCVMCSCMGCAVHTRPFQNRQQTPNPKEAQTPRTIRATGPCLRHRAAAPCRPEPWGRGAAGMPPQLPPACGSHAAALRPHTAEARTWRADVDQRHTCIRSRAWGMHAGGQHCLIDRLQSANAVRLASMPHAHLRPPRPPQQDRVRQRHGKVAPAMHLRQWRGQTRSRQMWRSRSS